jgi:hypothetical protein
MILMKLARTHKVDCGTIDLPSSTDCMPLFGGGAKLSENIFKFNFNGSSREYLFSLKKLLMSSICVH